MTKSMRTMLISAALTGLITGQSALAQKADKNADPSTKADKADKKEKHACKGQNSCKGNGGCGQTKGKNDCKGKGACATDPKQRSGCNCLNPPCKKAST